MPHNLRHGKLPSLRKVKDVTLIAAFKCSDGVVICADSQETLGIPLPDRGYAEYRVSVDKIEPLKLGQYNAVIGGAGHSDLVDGFTETLSDAVQSWDAGLGETELKSKIRLIVLDYHRHEVALCPAEDKQTQFIVCLKDTNETSAVYTWTIRGTSIKRVQTYALIGWDEPIYRHDIDRHYTENQKSLLSMLAGIHVFLLAEKTSNNIGPPTKIVVARPIGFQAIQADEIAKLVQRISDLDSAMDRLRLRLADTTVPLDEFTRDVSEFQTLIMNLRLTLSDEIVVAKLLRVGEVKNIEQVLRLFDPYLSLPSLEESVRALKAAWQAVTLNRRSSRDLAIVSNALAHAAHLMVELNGVAYEHKAITLEQRRAFAARVHDINEVEISTLEELKRLGRDIPDIKAQEIYEKLTKGVADPLITVASDFGKLFEKANEHANEIIHGIHAALLTMFTTGFVALFSKEPEPKQLEDINKGEIGSITPS
jgi:hypothetical protein